MNLILYQEPWFALHTREDYGCEIGFNGTKIGKHRNKVGTNSSDGVGTTITTGSDGGADSRALSGGTGSS
jgi:hypothetical protein